MHDTLIAGIKAFLLRNPPPPPAPGGMRSVEERQKLGYTPRELFPIVSIGDVARAEAELGFALPPLLTRLYVEISNGIAGFPYEILGLRGGCESDLGTLVETHSIFKDGDEEDTTGPWKFGMLPFCDWGSMIYSCVDCTESSYPIFTYENSGVWAEGYSLRQFFEMWLKGNVIFSEENVETETREGINPFTKEKITVKIRKRRKPE